MKEAPPVGSRVEVRDRQGWRPAIVVATNPKTKYMPSGISTEYEFPDGSRSSTRNWCPLDSDGWRSGADDKEPSDG